MMMSFRNGQTGVVLRVKVLDAAKADGSGKLGLTPASAGLVIGTLADVEADPVVYRAADGSIEPITTPGTFEAPTPGRCRFREVNAAALPGVYEIHLSDARFAVAGARSLLVSVSGAAGAAETDALVMLTVVDPFRPHHGFDPWAEAVPAAYPAESAGARLGRLDAAVSTRLAAADFAPPPAVAAIAAGVWDEAAAGHAAPGSFGARLDASVSSRSTFDGGPVAAVAAPVTVAAGGLDAIQVEPGINVRQALAPMLAALAGTVAGAGTGTVQIQGANSSATRIVATTDASGNRSSVALVLPA